MLALILANVRRRPGRTVLTASGIAVGVATIVALLALGTGLNRTAGQLVRLGRADLGIFQRDAADPTTSVLPLSLIRRLDATPEVAAATPLQLVVDAVPRNPGAIVFGVDPRGFVARRLVLQRGRRAGPGEVTVGDGLARSLGLRPGDRVRIGGTRLHVSGIYHSGITFEDGGAIVPLSTAQRLAGRGADEATTIAVELAPRVTAANAARRLRAAFPGIQIISDPEEATRVGANTVLIGKAVLLIVALALIVGGLGVANTMVMAVLEREREMALLATVGWSPERLAALVLGEAIVVSLIGASLGVLLGFAGSKLLAEALGLSDFVSPALTPWTIGRGLLVGTVIGVLGGLYPTWRVTRLVPAEALARG